MIVVKITMQVTPEKRQELLQALDELAEVKHQENGFCGAQIYLEMGRRGRLRLIEEWETLSDVEQYQRSEGFQILQGALRTLTTSAEIEIGSDRRITVRQTLNEQPTNGAAV